MKAVELLLIYRADRPSDLRRSLAIVAVLLGLAFAADRRYLLPDVSPANDGHALAALDMALSRVLCGTPSAFSLKYRAPMTVRDDPSRKDISMRQLLIQQAGSIDAYCRSIDQPFVNNENSLMVAEIGLLRLDPELSYVGVGRALHAMRVAALAVVAVALLESGFSVWMAGAVLFGGLAQLNVLEEHVASVYPFLFVLISLAVVLCAWSADWLRSRGAAVLGGAGIVAGFFSSFGVNMRTSYFPVYVTLFALFVAINEARAVRAGRSRRTAALRAGLAAATFAVGFWLFQYGFIARHIPANLTYNATTHSIAHPLVLALAVPENDFSRREGIHWQDSVGGDLAKRAIPDVQYLGPRYDEALFQYYRGLWRTEPREMVAVYWMKAKTAGSHMISVLRQGRGVAGRADRVVLAPLDLLPNGVWLLALYVALAVTGCRRAYVSGSRATWTLGLASAAAVLLQIESAVIMSFYVPNYHNYLVFYVIFISLWGWQLVVNAAYRRLAPVSRP